ncbi:MAG: sulfide/dihydroorotate dehydrogenase-like FAD/NAD-binding protein [Alphaproteobacteria bacterium]|jgi:ferredoxin--NADP+ reductase|nr:sulfide/dihydroorotate dehydrogenase-like FAD/NAD-binding protein [Alphaproteobacteria bacterium]
MFEILHTRQLTPVTKLFEVAAPLVAKAGRPGQFVILRVHGHGERIPVTITDLDPQAGTVTVVIQEVGATSKMANALAEGERFHDLAGPLGEPAPLREKGHVVCVGGGFGAAAILSILKGLKAKATHSSAIVGARTAELVILEDRLRDAADALHICTDDGSAGFKGLVTAKLEELITSGEPVDEIVAIGPMVMMRAVAATTAPHGIATLVSLDPIMIDGTGMCGACRVTVDGRTQFACIDGPLFDATKIDFDELVRRNKTYRDEEEAALHRYEQAHCRAEEAAAAATRP